MSPLYVGPANDTENISSLNAGIGDSSDAPIENDTQGRAWGALNKGKGLAWVKVSGFDGGRGTGNAFLVYSEFVDGRLYCMAARFAGNDSSESPADNGGRTKWMCCKNPNLTGSNEVSDWGSGTHTFNEHFDYGNEADINKSARTLCWNKTHSRSLFTFHDVDQTGQQDRLVYDMANTEAWSTRIKTRGPSSGTDYWQNGATLTSGSILSEVVEWGQKVDASYNKIYAGVSDAEANDAGSNDVAMIWIDNGSDFNDGLGLGWKRSGADSQWPRIFGAGGTTPTFDQSNDTSGAPENYYGIVCQNSDNGNMRNRKTAVITILVNIF